MSAWIPAPPPESEPAIDMHSWDAASEARLRGYTPATTVNLPGSRVM